MSGRDADRKGPLLTLALTLILMLPLVLAVLPDPRLRLYGEAGDAYGTLSDLVAVAEWTRGGPWPFRGTESQPVVDLPAGILTRLVGPVLAYNLVLLTSFPVAAIAGYLAARELGVGLGAAVVAGLLFAFSPFHLAHARQHLDQAQVWPAALVAWGCLRALRRPTATAGLGIVVTVIVAGLTNWYLPVLLAPLVGATVVANLVPPTRVRLTACLGTVAGLLAVAALVGATLPREVRMLRVSRSAAAADRQDLVRYSARPAEYFWPAADHPLLAGVVRAPGPADLHGSHGVEQTLAVGLTVLGLALVGAFELLAGGGAGRRAALVLVTAVGVSTWLSLPPWFGASGILYEVCPWIRAVARFAMPVQLLLVLLAGFGLDRIARRAWRRGRTLGLGGLLALLAVEYAYRPVGHWVEPAHVSAFLANRATAVADYPPHPFRFLRRFRGVGGARILVRGALAEADALDLGASSTAERLAALGVSHVVVHDAALAVGRGFTPVGGDDQLRVYEVSDPPVPLVVLAKGGFSEPEPGGRWLEGERGVLRLRLDHPYTALGGRLCGRFVSEAIDRTVVLTAAAGIRLGDRAGGAHAPSVTFAVPIGPIGDDDRCFVVTIDGPEASLYVSARPPGVWDPRLRPDDPRPLAVLVSNLRFQPDAFAVRGASWRFVEGFHDLDSGATRWLAADRGEVVIERSGPARVGFEVRAIDGPRRLRLFCDGVAVGERTTAPDRWDAVDLPLLDDCRQLALEAGPAVAISAIEGGRDDRRVTVAVRGFRIEPSDR